MANPVETFFQPQVFIAFITAVAGPVLLVIATNAKSKRRADAEVTQEAKENLEVGPKGSNVGFQALMEWSSKQLGENTRLNDQMKMLYREMRELRDRMADLEKTIALLQQHNLILSEQVKGLGGKPFKLQEGL